MNYNDVLSRILDEKLSWNVFDEPQLTRATPYTTDELIGAVNEVTGKRRLLVRLGCYFWGELHYLMWVDNGVLGPTWSIKKNVVVDAK